MHKYVLYDDQGSLNWEQATVAVFSLNLTCSHVIQSAFLPFYEKLKAILECILLTNFHSFFSSLPEFFRSIHSTLWKNFPLLWTFIPAEKSSLTDSWTEADFIDSSKFCHLGHPVRNYQVVLPKALPSLRVWVSHVSNNLQNISDCINILYLRLLLL